MKILSGLKIIGILAILLGIVSAATGDPGVSSGWTTPNNSVLDKTGSNFSSYLDNSSNITGMMMNRSDPGNLRNTGGNNTTFLTGTGWNISTNVTEVTGVNKPVRGPDNISKTTEIPGINETANGTDKIYNTTEIPEFNKSGKKFDNISNSTEITGINETANGTDKIYNTTEIPEFNKSGKKFDNISNVTEITGINETTNKPGKIYNTTGITEFNKSGKKFDNISNSTEITGISTSLNGTDKINNTTEIPEFNKTVKRFDNISNTTEITGISTSLNGTDKIYNTTGITEFNKSGKKFDNISNTTEITGISTSLNEHNNITRTTEITGNITHDNISAVIPPMVIEAWNLTQGADNITNTTDPTTGEISPVKNTSQNAGIPDDNTTAPYVPGEVIVQYKTTPLMNTIAGTIAKDYQVEAVGGEVADDHSAKGLEGLQTISVNNTSVSDVVTELNNSPIVEYAEPNYVISLDDYERESATIPNDPHFAEQWALLNTGQTGGTAGADIDATAGWSYSTGSKNVIIAVIDSGVDYTHPDLSANIWTNPGEIPGNGIDDDGDGYVDDVYGYDFINNKADPMDDNGHGTHCAGVIGAVGNNGAGITGLNWNVKIMPLKVLKADGTGDTASVLNAIAYAKVKGASIISCSWGGAANSKALGDALANSGMLIVCAAGNTGANNDINPHYPSNYDASNIIAVAASDANDKKPAFSNYGPLSVDVAAPGDAILSTYPTKLGSQYMSMRGTSMATPHASGLAGLILAMDPSLSPTEVKQVIMSHVDPLSSFSGKIVSGGRINVKSALSSLAKSEISLVALPGSSSLPTIGSDGKITDLNGNKRTDFADIVLFFKNSDWISSHEPISPFDLNNNGKVDFNDIILFYNRMI